MGRVAVLIVNYNGEAVIENCLNALMLQDRQPDAVLVADNASSDNSVALIKQKFNSVSLFEMGDNLGFAVANNRLMQQLDSDFEWVALLNPDTIVTRDWLARLIDAADRRPDVDMFSSQLRYFDEQHAEQLLANDRVLIADDEILDGAGDVYHTSGVCWRRGHNKPLAIHETLDEPVFAPCAAAGLYRLDKVLAVDGFDEHFFCYVEDVDLGFRLRLNGSQCQYVPDSVVYHIGSKITGKRSDFSVYYGHRNLVWTYVKNMPTPYFWLYLPSHLLINLVAIIMFMRKGRSAIILRSKWDALKQLPRVLKQRKEIQANRASEVKVTDSMMKGGAVLRTMFKGRSR